MGCLSLHCSVSTVVATRNCSSAGDFTLGGICACVHVRKYRPMCPAARAAIAERPPGYLQRPQRRRTKRPERDIVVDGPLDEQLAVLQQQQRLEQQQQHMPLGKWSVDAAQEVETLPAYQSLQLQQHLWERHSVDQQQQQQQLSPPGTGHQWQQEWIPPSNSSQQPPQQWQHLKQQQQQIHESVLQHQHQHQHRQQQQQQRHHSRARQLLQQQNAGGRHAPAQHVGRSSKAVQRPGTSNQAHTGSSSGKSPTRSAAASAAAGGRGRYAVRSEEFIDASLKQSSSSSNSSSSNSSSSNAAYTATAGSLSANAVWGASPAPSSSRPGAVRALNGVSSAYSVVPSTTGPAVAATAAAAAASAAAAAAAAQVNSRQPLAAEMCVPQKFWGIMKEQLRPWHKQVLVHLCSCLPPPACYVYQEMTPHTMQGVLAQRAVAEKLVREAYVELVWQQQRLRGWRHTASSSLLSDMPQVNNKAGRSFVSRDMLQQAQQELLHLKSAIGKAAALLRQLQAKAKAYSDLDYCQYSEQLVPLLQLMNSTCDTAREQQVQLVRDVQDIAAQAAEDAVFARSAAAAATVRQRAAQTARQQMQEQQQLWKQVSQQMQDLKQQLQQDGVSWRYPPQEFVLWRFKGRPGASRPPLNLAGLD